MRTFSRDENGQLKTPEEIRKQAYQDLFSWFPIHDYQHFLEVAFETLSASNYFGTHGDNKLREAHTGQYNELMKFFAAHAAAKDLEDLTKKLQPQAK